MRTLNRIAVILLIIGGLNWLLIGAFEVDLMAAMLGDMSILSRMVYIIIGIAAIYALVVPSRLASAHARATRYRNDNRVRDWGPRPTDGGLRGREAVNQSVNGAGR